MNNLNFQQPSPQFSPPVGHILKIGVVLLGGKFTLKSRLKTLHNISKAKNNPFWTQRLQKINLKYFKKVSPRN